MDDQAVAAAAGIWLVIALFGCVFGAAFYIYFSLALQKIADKTGTPNSGWRGCQ